MGLLQGKTAVITGGTRGLGLCIARAMVREGAAVVVASRSEGSVAEAVAELRAAGGKAEGFACDVADQAGVEALADCARQSLGGFDVWVNNAALSSPYGPTASVPTDLWKQAVQTNILGAYHGSVVALRHFLPPGKGKLINIVGRGDTGPAPFQTAYGSSKAFIRNFTLAMAKEYKSTGIGIFSYNPGLMLTDLVSAPSAVEGYEERVKVLGVVLKLLATHPEEPAEQVLWLASAATDGKTGLALRLSTPLRWLGRAAAAGLGRLLGRKFEPVPITVRIVPPDPGVGRR